jgi:hypothetical protein
MDLLGWLRKHLEVADTDLLREMVLGFVQALMSAEADVVVLLWDLRALVHHVRGR